MIGKLLDDDNYWSELESHLKRVSRMGFVFVPVKSSVRLDFLKSLTQETNKIEFNTNNHLFTVSKAVERINKDLGIYKKEMVDFIYNALYFHFPLKIGFQEYDEKTLLYSIKEKNLENIFKLFKLCVEMGPPYNPETKELIKHAAKILDLSY